MNVSIIGAGNMAKGIGIRVVAGGNKLTLHVKDIAKGEVLAGLIAETANNNVFVDVKPMGSPLDDSVIMAIPYSEVGPLLSQYSEIVSNKIIIDITNNVDFVTFQLKTAAGTSGAEEIAKLVPGSHIIKAFNTTFAGTLVTGQVNNKPLDVLMAGDSKDAKDILTELITSGGMRSLDVGSLSNARHLESMGLIHMMLQQQLNSGWMSALKFTA